jgi:hypothetical protein
MIKSQMYWLEERRTARRVGPAVACYTAEETQQQPLGQQQLSKSYYCSRFIPKAIPF